MHYVPVMVMRGIYAWNKDMHGVMDGKDSTWNRGG